MISKINDQLAMAEKIGQLACAFSLEDTKLIRAQLERAVEFRDTIAFIVNHCPLEPLDTYQMICDAIEDSDKEICIHEWVDPSNEHLIAGDWRLCTKCKRLAKP